MRVISDGAVKVCSGGDAWIAKFRTTDRAGRVYAMDVTFAYGNDTLYVLQYGRAGDDAQDAAANKALRSVCPLQSSATR